MKIFPKNADAPKAEPTVKGSREARGPSKAQKKMAPPKKEMSVSEIKEKLAANVQTSDAAKNKAITSTKKLGTGFLNDEVKTEMIEVVKPEVGEAEEPADTNEIETPNTKDFTLKSDIAKNDPKDTNTQEKLKSVISKGGFSFNPKEREALEKILANQ